MCWPTITPWAPRSAQGLKIAVPPILLDHAGDEASLAQLWRHFLRWAVTIRDLNPGAMPGPW
jgi:ceramide glucosyltransferase